MAQTTVFGIICEKKTNVSLLYATHNVSINGFTAHVNIEAEFINESQHNTEAKFVFPVEEDSAVYKFEAKIGDVHLVAKSKDKDVAQREYKEAVEKGMSAILLRETSTSGDIFEYNLGNIPPKRKITLQICLVSELSCEADGAVKFYMPFVLNSRYGITPKDENYQNAPKPREFSFNAIIKWKSQIKDVKSEHPIKTEYQENKSRATVKLTEKFNYEKDIVFLVYYEDIDKPQVIMEKGDGNAKGIFSKDIMMINLFPKLPQMKTPPLNDYIFIIDRSGSMNGEKIEAAKDTLLLFLKSLPLGCSFNLLAFNNYLEVLFKDGSRKYNEDSLNEALKFHNNLYAAGGTEMLSAIKSLSDKRSSQGFYRQVFLITDGEVYNTNEIIQLVKSQSYSTRYFSIGIGSGVSTELVKGIARAGRGQAEFVMTNDNLKAKVMRLLKLSMQPFVSSVRISAKDAESNKELAYNTVPENVPCIFTEESLIIYLVFQRIESTCQRVRLSLSGKVGESDFSLDFETNVLNQNDKEMQIHRLCVRRKIQELELKEDLVKGDNLKSEIIDLGTLANLVSKYTSFIGAEKSYKVSVTARENISKNFNAEKFQELSKIDNTKFNFQSKDRLKSLLLLQNFSGYWELNEFLAMVLKEPLDQLKQRKPAVSDNIWATALAVVFLTEKLTSQKNEWDLIVDKAIRWLKLQNTEIVDLDQIMTEASGILKTKIYS